MACARRGVRILCALWLCVPAAAQNLAGTEFKRHREAMGGVTEVDCAPCSSAPADLTVSGDALYFSADDGIHGRELWRLGADGELRLAADLGTMHSSSNPANLAAYQGGIAFAATPFEPGLNLLRQIYFLAPGAAAPVSLVDSGVAQDTVQFIVSDSWLYFDARTQEHGRELWVSDGTREGSRLVWDAVPGPEDGIHPNAKEALPAGGMLILSLALVPGHETRLTTPWTVAPPGFEPVPQTVGGNMGSAGYFPYTERFRDDVIVGVGGLAGEQAILRTNGIPEQNEFLFDPEEKTLEMGQIHAMGSHVYFIAGTESLGAELWRSDGIPGSERLVKDIYPGPRRGGPHKLTEVAGRLFFAANDGEHGSELWVSDGTPEGTRMVADLMPGPAEGAPYQLIEFQGLCYFAVENANFGEELWRSDGTPEGTAMVLDLHPGRGDAEPYYLTVFNDRLFFVANDGMHGEELWSTDGTAAGTRLEQDIMRPARREPSANPRQLTAYQGAVYCVAEDGTHGSELWKATPDAMTLVVDLAPGAASAGIEHLCVEDGVLHFDAVGADGARAHFESDGTAAGTQATGPALGRRAGPTWEDLLPARVSEALVPNPLAAGQWCAGHGLIAFAGYTDAEGWEPWVWRQGGDAPVLLRDHLQGPPGSFPQHFTASDEGIYYVAEVDAGVTALFRIEPESLAVARSGQAWVPCVTTRSIAPVPGGIAFLSLCGLFGVQFHGKQWGPSMPVIPQPGEHSWAPTELCFSDSALYFDFQDPIYGRELWVREVHEAQPKLIRDIFANRPEEDWAIAW